MDQPSAEPGILSLGSDAAFGAHRFSHAAMATIFEVFILHEDRRYAEQAAWASFDELCRLENELSRFVENSDISRISNCRAGEVLPIGPAAFDCLDLCTRLARETAGAFDITAGAFVDCWYSSQGDTKQPSQAQLLEAKKKTGVHLLELDEAEHTVKVLTSGIKIDLGGFGKGYAIDRMAEVLDDWGIENALLHGGYSTTLAIGAIGWPVTLSHPNQRDIKLAKVDLTGEALSGSGVGKGEHIMDPRHGRPITAKLAAWARARDAGTSDALSTAFMVMEPDEIKAYCEKHKDVIAMIVTSATQEKPEHILRFGSWPA